MHKKTAKNRDERRKGAIERFTKCIARDRINAREAAASPRSLETVEEHKARVAASVAYYQQLEEQHRQMLENTQNNMGKGSFAMRPRSKNKAA